MAQKSKKPVTIKAAWILFGATILSAIIALLTQYSSNLANDGHLNVDISLYEGTQIAETDSMHSQLVYQYYLTHYGDSLRNGQLKKIIRYTYDKAEGKVSIEPNIGYLNAPNQDTIIVGTNKGLECTYPVLSIKLVNNTKETVYFNSVRVDITSSKTLVEPVLRVSYLTENELIIINDGWGKLIEPKISFNLADSQAFDHIKSIKGPLKYSILLDDFDAAAEIDLSSFSEPPVTTYSLFDERSTGAGTIAFHNSPRIPMRKTVCAYGVLEYQNEKLESREFKFKTLVIINPHPHYQLQRTAGLIGFGSIYGLNLESGKSGYSKHISVSQAIKPGDVDQFLLLLTSNKSSRYHLKFQFLSLNNLIVDGNDVIVEFFIPRTGIDDELIKMVKTLELLPGRASTADTGDVTQK